MCTRSEFNNRKDKRLLVLLAFGAMVVGLRLAGYEPVREQEACRWLWLEVQGETGQVYRFTLRRNDPPDPADVDRIVVPAAGYGSDRLSLPLLLDRYKAVALRRTENGAEASADVSPRLSFLLGLPFPINHATEEELTMLPGIGPALAAHITSYREGRGSISGKRDLRSVRGIGRHLVDRLAPYLTFETER